MSKELFDKVINHEGRNYRYNSKEALLEWVDNVDYVDDENGELVKVTKDEFDVVDCIGLGRENAELDLMNYIERWHDDINEETAIMMSMEGF